MKLRFFRSGLAVVRGSRGWKRARKAVPVVALLAVTLLTLRLWPHDPLRGYYPGSVAVYARDGTLLRMALATDDQFRVWTPLEQMDPRLPAAVQAYEDRWFYWHPGFNPFALVRAAFTTYSGGKREGASTLTMQLARQLYGIRSQTIGGKLRQIAGAAWLELRYSKHDILEAYLNYAPYGGNVEGAGAASLIYFHKRPAQLTLPEVLTLAVIPQNPNKRGLRTDGPSPLMQARARLFRIWLAGHPRSVAYQSDLATPPHLYGVSDLPFRAPHLTDLLLHEHATDALAARSGEIRTTLDLRLQNTVERLVSQFIKNHRSVGIHNASVMLIDRTTGDVRALVGSADYFNNSIDGQVNGTRAKRSPGSTLKPFIYGLALDQGLLHPRTILKDAPSNFGPFSPENFDGRFEGPISAQQALVRSRNIPAVYVASRLKQPTLYEFLKGQHVSRLASERHYGLALALGGAELTMEELGRLYLMLGNRGVPLPLHYEQSIAQGKADGADRKAPHALSEAAAFITLQMLDTNVRPDTGRPAAPPVAWKTGTSWGFRDAWTAGIFGHYVLLVWVGNFDSTGNPAFIGIKAAAPLFFKIVDSIRAQHLDPGELARPWPANVIRIQVCAASGDLPNKWCKDTVPTWFIPGKSPIKVSDLDRAVRIDTRTGRATCKDGPYVKDEVFEFWPTDLRRLFRQAGMPRRTPPPLPDCSNGGSAIVSGDAFANPEDTRDNPQITSPIRGVTYTVRLSKPSPILLRANVSGRDRKLFWFANNSLIGEGSAGKDIAWRPSVAGKYELRAIDSEGRADAREVVVEFVE